MIDKASTLARCPAPSPALPPTITLDVDWLWHALAPMIGGVMGPPLARIRRDAPARCADALARLKVELFRTHGEEGVLARTRPSGAMALWMVAILLALLLAAYF